MAKLILYTCLAILCAHGISADTLRDVLDAMQVLVTTKSKYDDTTYTDITTCMNTIEPGYKASHDKAWESIISYFASGGVPTDKWGNTDIGYRENNVKTTQLQSMTVYEPCNFVSAASFYISATEICKRFADPDESFKMPTAYAKAIGRATYVVAVSSAFSHASHTKLGEKSDFAAIQAFVLLLHQTYLDPLPPILKTPGLYHLADSNRPKTALQVIDTLVDMHLNKPVTEWEAIIDSLSLPGNNLVFGTAFFTILSVAFNRWVVEILLFGFDFFLDTTSADVAFIRFKYLPELRKVLRGFKWKAVLKWMWFVRNTVGVAMKASYFIFWEEKLLKNNFLINSPFANIIGHYTLPGLFLIANIFTSFKYYNEKFQFGLGAYPGCSLCNDISAHAKFHAALAISCIDLYHMTDAIYGIIKTLID